VTNLETELRATLRAHADEFEPRPDAYDVLLARVESEPGDQLEARRKRSVAPRLLVAAVSLVLLGAAGLFLADRTGNEAVVALPSTSVTSDPSSVGELDESETEADGSNDAAVTPDEPTFAAAPAPADFVLGPRAATWQLASLEFLDLIQRQSNDAVLEAEGSIVHVSERLADGSLVPVTDLELGSVELDTGELAFAVVAANSSSIRIESPAALSVVADSSMEVSGTGTDVAGPFGVQLISGNDGVKLLTQTAATVGSEGSMVFETSLPVAGTEWAWVVVDSQTQTRGQMPAFSAVPLSIRAPLPADSYLVTAIPSDDADGLWVRHLPGAEQGEALVALPPGQANLRVRGLPAVVDGQVWWNIWLPEKLEGGRSAGWVNSRHLARQGDLDESTLSAVAEDFIGAYKAGGVGFDAIPWSSRRPVNVGWSGGLVAFSNVELSTHETWDSEREWAVPAERFGDPTMIATMRKFVDSLAAKPNESEFAYDHQLSFGTDPVMASPYGIDQETLTSMFVGTSWVQISDPLAGGSEWQTTTLFVEAGVTGPELVGVVVTMWIP